MSTAGKHLHFLEIGTSDFDTCLQKAGPLERGLSVEPLKVYLDALPSKPNVLKVNAAVSDKDGEITIYYIPPDVLKANPTLPGWLRGCNSVGKPHPLHAPYASLVKSQTVPVLSFSTLVKNYGISAIDYLKIDTEGHDCTIVRGVVAAIKACLLSPPKRILFETNANTPARDVDEVLKLLAPWYKVKSRGHDTEVVLINPLRNVFAFWTGPEPMLVTELRKLLVAAVAKTPGARFILLTPENVKDWVTEPLPACWNIMLPAHKADWLRVCALAEHGGMYVDSDTLPLQPFTSLFELSEKYSCVLVTERDTTVCNGLLLCKPQHPLFLEWKARMIKAMPPDSWSAFGSLMVNPLVPSFKSQVHILNGPETVYPVIWHEQVAKYLDAPAQAAATYKRKYQPLIMLVNSLYKEASKRYDSFDALLQADTALSALLMEGVKGTRE